VLSGLSPDAPASPFAPWFLATRRPEAFVRALEAAMRADGCAAQGLAAHALATRMRLRFGVDPRRHAELGASVCAPRGLRDPVRGVPAPVFGR